jgi:hypothetical protein
VRRSRDGGLENMSYRQFVNSFLPYHPMDLLIPLILKIDQDDIMWDKLLELDLLGKNSWSKNATPADIRKNIK